MIHYTILTRFLDLYNYYTSPIIQLVPRYRCLKIESKILILVILSLLPVFVRLLATYISAFKELAGQLIYCM